MRRFLLILLSLIAYEAKSCDVCGGSLGSSYFGLLPQMSKSFVGVNYMHSRFAAAMIYNSEVLEDEFSDDVFNRIEVNARFTIARRLQASIILPYAYNDMKGTHQSISDHGISDPSALLSYRFFDKNDEDKRKVNHSLLVGVGVKLPFGNFEKRDDGEVINRNFQLGTGSVDYILSMNHSIMFNSVGLNTDASFKFNSKNKRDYRFGNQVAASANIFWIMKLSSIVVVPLAGLYFEYGGIHTEGMIEQTNTGGEVLMSNIGFQIMVSQFVFNLSYKIPVYQHFNSDRIASIDAGNRLMVGLNYNF